MRTERRSTRRILGAALAATLLAPLPAEPAQAQSEQERQPAVLELSLQDAIELALRHNLQVRIASLNPDLSEEQIRFQRSTFDPVFTFNVPQAFQRSTQPQASALSGADVLTQEVVNGGFQMAARTGWGLSWSFAGSAQRFLTNNEFSTFNPRYDTSFQLNVRQPLLRNFGTGTNERLLLVARNDYAVSEEQFRLQLQQQLFQVLQAYWVLVSQYRSYEISQRSLQLAQEQLDRNNTMVRIGVLAAVDVIQTQQQVAFAEANLIQSEINLRNQEDTVKQLLNLDAVVPEGWDVELVPTEEPQIDPPVIDVDAALAEALARSPSIIQDRINHDSRRIDLSAANNQLLPQVDFIGSMQLSGLGGDQIFRSGVLGSGGGVTEIQEGGIADSFAQLLSGDFRTWSLGLQVSFPVRNDAARAQYAQASIRERQAATQLHDRELQIRLQVRNAARNVAGGDRQVQASQEAMDLAERQYTAELRRFQQGLSNTFQVLNFQRLLTGAQQNQLNSLINLNLALASFHLAKGTLLDWLRVEIDEAGSGGPMRQARAPSPVGSTAAEAAAARELAETIALAPSRPAAERDQR